LSMDFRVLKTRRNPQCPVCGDKPTITELIDYHEYCGLPIPPELEEQRAHAPHAAGPASSNGHAPAESGRAPALTR
ncbi:MAG TPA: MoaD family protein, partial [Chloroflexota bacterium]|nr:MoaD family protein [Chloroflexota bacterium]